jgi:hypothetical protein
LAASVEFIGVNADDLLLRGIDLSQALLFEDTQLAEAVHPILRVPGANNLAIFEFMDVDNLNVHFPVL